MTATDFRDRTAICPRLDLDGQDWRRFVSMQTTPDAKTLEDLRAVIPDFDDFQDVLRRYGHLINRGKLAEYYCQVLFGLKPATSSNNPGYDARMPTGERVEIKYRRFAGKAPPGMRINWGLVDCVLYVELDEELLPAQITRIDAARLTRMKNERCSFRQAISDGTAQILFSIRRPR